MVDKSLMPALWTLHYERFLNVIRLEADRKP
jgi:hypothetical protein